MALGYGWTFVGKWAVDNFSQLARAHARTRDTQSINQISPRSFLALLFLLAAAASALLRLRFRLGCSGCSGLFGCFCSRDVLHRDILNCFIPSVSIFPHSRTSCANPPSSFSGNAAIYLPARPNPAINRPTSAALSVLNFNVTPDSGSYVFSVRVARGTLGAAAASLLSSSFRFLFRAFWYFGESRFGMLYFVVIRVCD